MYILIYIFIYSYVYILQGEPVSYNLGYNEFIRGLQAVASRCNGLQKTYMSQKDISLVTRYKFLA